MRPWILLSIAGSLVVPAMIWIFYLKTEHPWDRPLTPDGDP